MILAGSTHIYVSALSCDNTAALAVWPGHWDTRTGLLKKNSVQSLSVEINAASATHEINLYVTHAYSYEVTVSKEKPLKTDKVNHVCAAIVCSTAPDSTIYHSKEIIMKLWDLQWTFYQPSHWRSLQDCLVWLSSTTYKLPIIMLTSALTEFPSTKELGVGEWGELEEEYISLLFVWVCSSWPLWVDGQS